MTKLQLIIPPREKDLGGFSVRRLLPCTTHKMVGPFIFFDHMGPANFSAQQGIAVRPHPHIHLATVTYLFEGQIQHRDSLGSNQIISPGDINWMMAGRGIVHSERTPQNLVATGSRLSGIQCWVAIPQSDETLAPSFKHYDKTQLPEFEIGGVQFKLLLGELFDQHSPVKVNSDLFYASVAMPAGTSFIFPAAEREAAVYVVSGSVQIQGMEVPAYSMAVLAHTSDALITASQDAKLMLLGGKSFGERYIYWNFVSSSVEKILEAKLAWQTGPGSERFPFIPGDDKEFIPLPSDENGNPKGTIM